MSSNSHSAFQTSVSHAERLLQGTKQGRGKPTQQEVSMFVASVVLTYAAWEGFIEDVAVEANSYFAANAVAGQVPAKARQDIESANPTPWELTLDPGWRELWRTRVKEYAKGSDDDGPPFGMNTANVRNISTLFGRVGLDPWRDVEPADRGGVDKLVNQRGTVAHTGGAPNDFRKALAQEHLQRVHRLVDAIDESLAAQLEGITGTRPW